MHAMVPSTGLWPVDATPLALPGVVWRGVTPSTIRKIEKINRFYYPYEILKEYFLLRKYRKYMGNIYLTTNPK